MSTVPTAPLALLASGVLACGGGEAPAIVARHQAVIQTLALARADAAGVSSGFDLDGAASDSLDSRSCHHADFVDPEGRPGIDNQLAVLLPLIDLLGEGAVGALLQQAINEGRLLLLLTVEEDSEGGAQLRFERGEDVPLLGTDGLLLPGQTLALQAEPLLGEARAWPSAEQVFEAGPFALRIPVVIFNNLYALDLIKAHVRFVRTPEGALEGGVIGGGVSVEQMFAIAETAGREARVDIIGSFGGDLRDMADLEHDASGACGAMSMAATFHAVPAFIFE